MKLVWGGASSAAGELDRTCLAAQEVVGLGIGVLLGWARAFW